MEVMELVFLGLSDKEIPEYLPVRRGSMVSVSTVRNIIVRIKEKIHANHRTELSLWWAIQNYNISVDWTPLKRKICAVMMLVLLAPSILLLSQDDMIRTHRPVRTGRTISSRARTSRRDGTSPDLEEFV